MALNVTLPSSSPMFQYTPFGSGAGWTQDLNTDFFVHRARADGTSVELFFEGNSVAVRGFANCSYDVIIDNKSIPFGAAAPRAASILFESGVLDGNRHTMSIRPHPTEQQLLQIDAAVVSFEASEFTPNRLLANDNATTYTGLWTGVSPRTTSDTITNGGAFATFAFEDTDIVMVRGNVGPESGQYKATLDGDDLPALNGTSINFVTNTTLFMAKVDNARRKSHTLIITNSGSGNDQLSLTEFMTWDIKSGNGNGRSDKAEGGASEIAILVVVITLVTILFLVAFFFWRRRRLSLKNSTVQSTPDPYQWTVRNPSDDDEAIQKKIDDDLWNRPQPYSVYIDPTSPSQRMSGMSAVRSPLAARVRESISTLSSLGRGNASSPVGVSADATTRFSTVDSLVFAPVASAFLAVPHGRLPPPKQSAFANLQKMIRTREARRSAMSPSFWQQPKASSPTSPKSFSGSEKSMDTTTASDGYGVAPSLAYLATLPKPPKALPKIRDPHESYISSSPDSRSFPMPPAIPPKTSEAMKRDPNISYFSTTPESQSFVIPPAPIGLQQSHWAPSIVSPAPSTMNSGYVSPNLEKHVTRWMQKQQAEQEKSQWLSSNPSTPDTRVSQFDSSSSFVSSSVMTGTGSTPSDPFVYDHLPQFHRPPLGAMPRTPALVDAIPVIKPSRTTTARGDVSTFATQDFDRVMSRLEAAGIDFGDHEESKSGHSGAHSREKDSGYPVFLFNDLRSERMSQS